jgi:cytochrome c
VKFNNPMDMEFGPDGKLYVIEYGTKWFGHNEDARLVRIDWNSGNRPPSAVLNADQSAGVTPLVVNFSASASEDPDGTPLKYELQINDTKLASTDGKFNFTFDKAGVYRPRLTVTDPEGVSANTELVIIAGNAVPQLSIAVKGNQTYFFPGAGVSYQVVATDQEDGSTADGKIKAEAVDVTVDFMEQGYDKTIIAQGHQRPNHPGQILIAESDCKSCHLIDQKSAGPAYRDVAKRYAKDPNAIEILSAKVIKGGSGVWGDVAMSAHPQISKENASQMVSYILSLAEEKENKLGLSGAIKFDKPVGQPGNTKSAYVITASYEDNGNGKVPPLSVSANYYLRAPFLTADDEIEVSNIRVESLPMMGNGFVGIKDGSSVTFKNVDLTSVKSLALNVVELTSQHKSGAAEVYLDGLNGQKLGAVDFSKIAGNPVQSGVLVKAGKISFAPLNGNHSVVVVFKNSMADKAQDLFIFVNGNLAVK